MKNMVKVIGEKVEVQNTAELKSGQHVPSKISNVLVHTYEYDSIEETKILGVYSSKEKAKAAIDRYIKLDGFKDYPRECFYIMPFIIDEDSEWTEGFVSVDKLETQFRKLTIHFNNWLEYNITPETAWQREDYYNFLCDISNFADTSQGVIELAKYIKFRLKKRMRINKTIQETKLIAEHVIALYCNNSD